MRCYIITYFMINTRGMRLGSEPIVFRFYSSSSLDTECLSFQRMLLEYGRALGRSGSYVEIISLEK